MNAAATPTAVADADATSSRIAATSDHALMLAVRDGDIARLGELFERHHGRLYGFFVRLTADRGASEDLVQLVFQRVLRYRHTYRDAGCFTAWLYQIGRRMLADYQRHASVSRQAADVTTLETLADNAPHAADSAASSDETVLLHRALAALSSDEREILVLARFQDMRHDDIAQLLGLSVGAVKVRVHRAMKELRRVYLSLERPRRNHGPENFSGGHAS